MGLPRYAEVHLPLLKLIYNQRIHCIKEAEQLLAKYFNLNDMEINERVGSGGRKFHVQVNFSFKLLKEAGLILNKIKPYKATDSARKLIKSNPKRITRSYLNYLIKTSKQKKLEDDKALKSQMQIEINLEKILKMNETEFEYFSAFVLSKKYNLDYFIDVEITPPNNDGGIDGILHIGKTPESKIYIQAKKKRKKYSIGEQLLRDFTGAMIVRKGRIGYFVTTSSFTEPAVTFVEKLKDQEMNITLIDGQKLVELFLKYELEKEIILE